MKHKPRKRAHSGGRNKRLNKSKLPKKYRDMATNPMSKP